MFQVFLKVWCKHQFCEAAGFCKSPASETKQREEQDGCAVIGGAGPAAKGSSQELMSKDTPLLFEGLTAPLISNSWL